MNWVAIAILGAVGLGAWAWAATHKPKKKASQPFRMPQHWFYRGWNVEAEPAPNNMWNWTASPPTIPDQTMGQLVGSSGPSITDVKAEVEQAIDAALEA